jgi:hypothetical protein
MIPTEDDSGIESTYSDDGVDLTLIRWMLSLTPAERLDALQQFADFILSARARNTALSQSAGDSEYPRG